MEFISFKMEKLRNSTIEFLEPFPRKIGNYYINAIVTKSENSSVKELKIEKRQQKEIIDYLISVDRKLLCAVVYCDNFGNFIIKRHSPQLDFLELIEQEKCIQ